MELIPIADFVQNTIKASTGMKLVDIYFDSAQQTYAIKVYPVRDPVAPPI